MTTLDLTTPDGRKTASSLIEAALDTHVIQTQSDPYRTHLGASVIGHNCNRWLWYHFRWMFKATFPARMYRLFRRGHREEVYIRNLLRGAGATFLDKMDETGKQVHVSFFGGHFSGSVDGVFCWPELGLPEPMILECKTSKTGAPFTEAQSRQLAEHNMRHYKQQAVYCHGLGIKYVCYVMVNKNDDNWTWEVVAIDPRVGEGMITKALTIISSVTPPPRLSDKPEYWECRYCDARHICHESAAPERNCRSCRYAMPTQDGQWFCSNPANNAAIPKDFIPQGCALHESLPK